jgi:hypothetical protein
MPIRPEHRRLYPFNWKLLSASIRFRRAKGRCERCGRPQGELVAHLGDGRWWDADSSTWRTGKGRRLPKLPPLPAWLAELPRTRIVLACAHLDHDPTNNAGYRRASAISSSKSAGIFWTGAWTTALI